MTEKLANGGACQILSATSSTRMLNPRFLSFEITYYDQASNICRALSRATASSHADASTLFKKDKG